MNPQNFMATPIDGIKHGFENLQKIINSKILKK